MDDNPVGYVVWHASGRTAVHADDLRFGQDPTAFTATQLWAFADEADEEHADIEWEPA